MKSGFSKHNNSIPSRQGVPGMFDRIVPTYDFLNRVLSFGQDKAWRSASAKSFPKGNGFKVVDVATGTADQLISILKYHKIKTAVGLDKSNEMLSIARNKIIKQKFDKYTALIQGDALSIPLKNKSVELVTISFGIRNFSDLNKALSEVKRVLKPKGKIIILEFSIPKNHFIKYIYLFYLRNLVPFVGSIISGNRHAYSYLNKTIETFPYGEEFCKIMQDAGFSNVNFKQLSFGIATIYEGDKK